LKGGAAALTATISGASAPAQFGVGGDLDGSPASTPLIFPGGVVNAANFAAAETPAAPGSIMSLFGTNLADQTAMASSLPLPAELAGVKVLVGGSEAPLISVFSADGDTPDQINFVLPQSLANFSYAEIVVSNNGVLSAPEGINIAPSVPAMFTL